MPFLLAWSGTVRSRGWYAASGPIPSLCEAGVAARRPVVRWPAERWRRRALVDRPPPVERPAPVQRRPFVVHRDLGERQPDPLRVGSAGGARRQATAAAICPSCWLPLATSCLPFGRRTKTSVAVLL